MRTTVTLDDDVAAAVQRMARERGMSFKAALNAAVRAGIGAGAPVSRNYVVPTRPMGPRPGVDVDKALRLAGSLEDEEILRKLELRT